MSRLEEDKANSTSQIADAQAETEKREERLRAMATKVGLKQFAVLLILCQFGFKEIGKIDKSCSNFIEIIPPSNPVGYCPGKAGAEVQVPGQGGF